MNWRRSKLFANQSVRDLSWILSTPDLLNQSTHETIPSTSFSRVLYEQYAPKLTDLAKQPTAIEHFLQQRCKRHRKLGLYFEDLWLYWVTTSGNHSLLAHDSPVYRNKQTIGAFDLLLQNDQNHTEHWELAVKFYLGTNNSERWDKWIGPGRRDRLSQKMSRLFDHQIQLSDFPEAKEHFAKQGWSEVVNRRILLKGYFFQQWKTSALPSNVSDQAPIGVWIEQSQIRSYITQFPFTYRFTKRNKPDWLSNAYLPRKNTEDIRDLPGFATTRDLPFLISILKGTQMVQEVQRLFVVPDGWFD